MAERTKVWTEPPRSKAERRVAVVYYLCRNGHLQHPHFMEVPLSSPRGLFLRDVIGRLNSLRGEGFASLYSWSTKRKYNKNGFVWEDLEENDFIYPTHGHEYILKGSELIHSSEETAELADVRKSRELTVTAWRCNANRVHNTELLTDKPPINQVVEEKEDRSRSRSRSSGEISTPPSETLAALMKADRRLIFVNEARKAAYFDPNVKPKASSLVLQIMSCGPTAAAAAVTENEPERSRGC